MFPSRIVKQSWIVALAVACLFQLPAAAQKKGKKKQKDVAGKSLEGARAFSEQGKTAKAWRAYELADQLYRDDCLECLVGAYRSTMALGRYAEASWYTGAVMDVVFAPEPPPPAPPPSQGEEESPSDDAEPEAAEPENAEPEDAEPEDTEPEDAEPEDAEPEDAEPEAPAKLVPKPPPFEIDEEALLDELEQTFQAALDATGGEDPDVVWGLIEILSRRGEASAIVRLAERYLDTSEEKALICAADTRASVVAPVRLEICDEINEELRRIGWDGPLLVASDMRRPKERRLVPNGGRTGAWMAGVVDRTGALKHVRQRRPLADKLSMKIRDDLRRAAFDAATYRGQRTMACYPFSIRLAGAKTASQAPSASPAAPSAAAGDTGLKTVEPVDLGDRVLVPPVKVSFPDPAYTEEARQAGIEGVVIAQVIIDTEGRVEVARVLKELPMGLTESAVAALETWEFTPATLDGEPVAVYYNLTVNFRLP